MDRPQHSPASWKPRIIAQAPAEVRPPAVDMAKLKKHLASDIRIVKRARFNAAKRFEAKNDLSLVAVAMFSLYLIFVSIYLPLYEDVIPKDKNRLLNLISITSSVFILIVSFLEQMKDYKAKAAAMHKCGTRLARLLQGLEAYPVTTSEELQWYSGSYNDIVDDCPWNHDDVDLNRAVTFDLLRKESKTAFDTWRIIAAWCHHHLNVFGVYAVLIIGPFVALLLVIG